MADGNPPSSSSAKKPKTDRTIVERNRRIHMNQLCSRLSSLMPPQPHFNPSQMRISQADQIEQATHYVMETRERLELLRERKQQLQNVISEERRTPNNYEVISDDDDDDEMLMNNADNNNDNNNNTRIPIIQITDLGDEIEVHLVTGVKRNLKLGKIIRVLEEEGAEVVNSTFSNQGDKLFHTLHAKALNSRIGMETARIQQRLQELI